MFATVTVLSPQGGDALKDRAVELIGGTHDRIIFRADTPTRIVIPITYAEPSSVRAQRRRRGVRGLGVVLLAQAGNTYRAHDCAIDTDRHAAAQHRDAGSDEGRAALIYVVLDLCRRPL
jgi:hypothetical protein